MQLSVEELKKLLPEARLDRRGKNIKSICPKCGSDEFGVSIAENHLFGCFRKKNCGFTGNIFTLLAALGKSVYDVKPTFLPGTKIDVDKMFVHQQEKIDLELADCKLPIGWKRVYEDKYLEGRGFTNYDFEKFEAGVTEIDSRYKDFIIFPIRQFGYIKGTVARNKKTKKEIEDINAYYKLKGSKKKELRYRNSDSDFAKILLGIEEITDRTDTVILVEGLFDKVNTDRQLQLDIQEEVKCCATFKCAVSPEQMFLLQQNGIKTLVLLYDPDVPEEIKKTAWELDPYFDVHVGFNKLGNDPGDMKIDEFDSVFANLKSPSQFQVGTVSVPKLKKK